jgi:hypothetical protein
MGASFGYTNADSLDISWLPLSRFESRVACVAVAVWSARSEGRGRRSQYPLRADYAYIGKAVDGRIVQVCKRR